MNNRLIAIAFMTVFTAAMAPVTFANDNNPALAAEVKFIGKVQNNPVFQLTVAGTGEQDDYVISIRDEYGNTLHSENVKAVGFTKKFMLNLDEFSDYNIQFYVSSKKTKKSVLYTVNNSTRNFEEVVVSKI